MSRSAVAPALRSARLSAALSGPVASAAICDLSHLTLIPIGMVPPMSLVTLPTTKAVTLSNFQCEIPEQILPVLSCSNKPDEAALGPARECLSRNAHHNRFAPRDPFRARPWFALPRAPLGDVDEQIRRHERGLADRTPHRLLAGNFARVRLLLADRELVVRRGGHHFGLHPQRSIASASAHAIA